ncbi:MAG: hypothetical protein ACI4JM_10625 [Oscillospiraceae bacterium]
MTESKIILFIVEGKSDKAALAPALEKIITNSTVKFKVMCADITSDFDSTVQNIERRIKTLGVKRFLQENSQFSAKNICGIVHVVDLDGAFIPSDSVIEGDTIETQYLDDSIICKDKSLFLKSKKNKKENLIYLSKLSEISIPTGIVVPYSIFYMSCNLDHVLHNKRNSTKAEKKANSIIFADNYDEAKTFEEFFNGDDIKIKGTYKETWDYAQIELNSLKRGSNFWICIEENKNI